MNVSQVTCDVPEHGAAWIRGLCTAAGGNTGGTLGGLVRQSHFRSDRAPLQRWHWAVRQQAIWPQGAHGQSDRLAHGQSDRLACPLGIVTTAWQVGIRSADRRRRRSRAGGHSRAGGRSRDPVGDCRLGRPSRRRRGVCAAAGGLHSWSPEVRRPQGGGGGVAIVAPMEPRGGAACAVSGGGGRGCAAAPIPAAGRQDQPPPLERGCRPRPLLSHCIPRPHRPSASIIGSHAWPGANDCACGSVRGASIRVRQAVTSTTCLPLA